MSTYSIKKTNKKERNMNKGLSLKKKLKLATKCQLFRIFYSYYLRNASEAFLEAFFYLYHRLEIKIHSMRVRDMRSRGAHLYFVLCVFS
jgi:hypothetical protein